jgi:DNA-binding transcriptional LysR family regulator
VPTERANDLAAPIADILARVRSVVARAEGFDAERSARRFTIGAPDAVFAVILPPLLAALAKFGPEIDLAHSQCCRRARLPISMRVGSI